MEKVILYAYTAHNLGDDLFICTMCQHYPDTTFFLYAPKRYKKTFQDYPNLNIIPSDSLLRRVFVKGMQLFQSDYRFERKIAQHCDTGIYLGGSLFIENNHWQDQVAYLQYMIKQHDTLLLIGANFGPFTSEAFLEYHQKLFSQFTALSFRDQFSKKLFDHPNSQEAADVVFQLDTAAYQRKTTETVVISVIYPAIRPNLKQMNETYFTFIAYITKGFIRKGYTVTFMSFCKIEKDPVAIKEIVQLIDKKHHPNISIFHYETNAKEALALIARAKAVIATRFHAMILGWLFNKPTYPIVYSNKMQTVIEEYHFPGKYSHIEELETIDINEVLEAIQTAPFSTESCVRDAKKHFNLIDAHMKKE